MRIDALDRRLWWAVLILACALLTMPLLLVDVPPLLDYPNHLARMVLLAWPHDPVLARMAEPRWGLIPDLAIDAVLPPLLHVLPVHVAGRLAVTACVLLPFLGAVAYSGAVFRGRSWWVLGAGLVAWNQALLLGFLNFSISLGMALLLAALWIAQRESHPVRTVLLAAAGAVVVFFCHLMGVLVFAALLGGYEAETLWRMAMRGPAGGGAQRPRDATPRVAASSAVRLAIDGGVFLLPAALYGLSPLRHLSDQAVFLPLSAKLAQLLVPLANYSLPLDIATAATVAAFLLLCLITRRCRMRLCSVLALLCFIVLYAVAPAAAKGAQNIDTRLLVTLGFLLFAGLLPGRLPTTVTRLAAACFAALFLARMVVFASTWQQSAADIAALRGVIARVEPGSSVFVAEISPEAAPLGWRHAPRWRRLSTGLRTDLQMAALVLIDRHAFWPFLFDNESQQPIALRPAYDALALRVGAMPLLGALRAVDLCGFDYVLVLDADLDPALAQGAPAHLVLLSQSGFAALFRVLPQPRACGGA
jgi:hypothetical protein